MISIVIPTFDEADQIAKIITSIRNAGNGNTEIIIVDGGSSDDTRVIAQAEGVNVITGPKGRGKQMNYGASLANGELLFFLHADSIPPQHFIAAILNAHQNGALSGCFRLAFDHHHWFLKANSWFTRFDVNAVRFGDQGLFVTKEVFEKSGGFKEELMLMEDQEIIHRLKKYGRFVVLNDVVTTSARKYLQNGIYYMQVVFFRIWALYYLGYSQENLLNLYRRLINKHKF